MSGPVLIKQLLLGGRAVTVVDVDNPDAGVLAVAMLSADGWSVAKGGTGEVVGERMAKKSATWLLTRTARQVAETRTVRSLLALPDKYKGSEIVPTPGAAGPGTAVAW